MGQITNKKGLKFKKNTFVLVDQICFFQHKVNKNQKNV